MSDGIRRLETIRIRGQQAIEELRTIKDRCALYAEDLRIAQEKLRESEDERETLKSERRGLLGLVRAALVDIVGTEGKHLLDLVGSVKAKLRESVAERDRLARELAEAKQSIDGLNEQYDAALDTVVRMQGELAEAQTKTARRCAEIAEAHRQAWLNSHPQDSAKDKAMLSGRADGAATVAAEIRREFGLDAARNGGPDAH